MWINSAEGTETVEKRCTSSCRAFVKTRTCTEASAVDEISLLQPVICDSVYIYMKLAVQ